MRGVLAFGRFESARLARSWRFLLITVGFPVSFYMLFLGDRRASEVVASGVTWREYLMVTMCSFGCLVAGLTAGGGRLAAERASGWARQLRVTPIPPWSYVVVKTTTSMLVMAPIVVLVEVVGWSFGGIHLSAATWLELAALMWLAALPFAEMGILIGFVAGVETTFPIITALMFVLGYFGGLFNPVSSMPDALRIVARILPSYYHATVGVSVLSSGGQVLRNWAVLAAYSVGLGLVVAVRHKREEMRGLA